MFVFHDGDASVFSSPAKKPMRKTEPADSNCPHILILSCLSLYSLHWEVKIFCGLCILPQKLKLSFKQNKV